MVTELYINGYQVDLFDEINIPITYCIADIREPDKRQSSFSKTISIPATKNNNRIFSHIWDVRVTTISSGTINLSPYFNPAKKAEVNVFYDGANCFSGIIQLNSIIVNDAYIATYECSMFSSISGLYSQMGEKKLNEIDLSEYNHTYSLVSQVLSWNTSITKNGGTYINFSGGLPTGEGYCYPMIDYGRTNGTTFDVMDFFPAVYLKTLTDKIIGDNGYTYESDFFNSEFYKRLIVPFNSGTLKLTDSQISLRTFWAGLQTSKSINYSGNNSNISYFNFTDESTNPYYDSGNIHTTNGTLGGNTVSYVTIPNNSVYTFWFRLNLTITHYPSGGSGTISPGYLGYIRLMKWNSGTPQIVYSTFLWVNNFPIQGQPTIIYQNANVTTGNTDSLNNYIVGYQMQCYAGEIYYWVFENKLNLIGSPPSVGDLYGQPSSSGGYTNIEFKPDCYFRAFLSTTNLSAGDTIDMNSILPNNIKQADLITSIIKAFNLFVMPDSQVKNKLIIEPRDDFYSSGITVDYTDKLDYSKDWNIIPMGELDAKTYIFKYKDDGDYYNEFYQKRWGDNYGLRRYSIDNDFLKQEIKTELIFSPTPLADYIGIDRIIPKIFGVTNNNVPEPKTSNIRLLYWGGVKTTGNMYTYTENGNSYNYISYLYAGHLDDTVFPSVDLNFAIPQEVYYTATSYTNGNLFNRFHRKYIQEISDSDSRIFIGYFNLKPIDISSLDFRNQFYFEDTYWRLNKIYDFNPLQSELTKCEFVKLREYNNPTISSGTIRGGKSFISSESSPTYGQAASELSGGRYSFNIGVNNAIPIGSVGALISGRGNTVNGNEVSILSSSGVTANGDRIVAFNCLGTTINANNTIAINCSNITISSGGIWLNDRCAPDFAENHKVRLVSSDYSINLSTDNTIYCSTAGGDINIYLPPASLCYSINKTTRGFTIAKVSSDANKVQVLPYGSDTIEGAGSYLLNSIYNLIYLIAYDGKWILKSEHV